ncbi:glucosylglycerol hydrolase [Halobacteriaceae archaeon SHR40]|uniref:glucosylglycerol hydrolase n=1 Tax=Halovenus amylolytica TaxID=2500550 RepID=UPI000FE2C1EF
MTDSTTATVRETETARLCKQCQQSLDGEAPFDAARELVPRLGAHWQGEYAEFGFWTPALDDEGIPPGEVYLELFTPTGTVELGAEETTAQFRHERVPTQREGEYTWAAVSGVRPGTRDELGTLYRLGYEKDGRWTTIGDPLAYSLPFGAYAPAELYDLDRLDENRADREYFESLGTSDEELETTETVGLPQIEPAMNLLEIHPGTATEAGSLAGLTDLFETIGRKQRNGTELATHEQAFAGYDGVQLMPVAPITECDYQPEHFEPTSDLPESETATRTSENDGTADATEITVTLRRPQMINWGYDIVIYGFGAVNASILETGRPDELVDFIATLHTLPDPMRVVFDIALGHADDGAIPLLNDYYFEGPGMYGQELDYTQPTVRAILLELQRRKMDWGADGIRVDGAQDFTNWDPETESEYHDDEFLAEMKAVTQEVAGTEYSPWMIYEDGRPWPESDWELASTYRELIKQHPDSFQWGPVTFAHNTPAILTFWATKWWRVREVADMGGQWISGVANHDTLRRGVQAEIGDEWNAEQENPYLADSIEETIERAYDNPASNVLFYCFMPGVPMDFTHANMHAPWDFVRDTDDTWNLKVVAEAAYFVDWRVPADRYERAGNFTRLKELGFDRRDDLHEFVHALASAVEITDYDREGMATILSTLDVPFTEDGVTAAALEEFGLAWMRDVGEFCKLSNWTDELAPEDAAFGRSVRAFRHERPWLRDDLDDDAVFDYLHPTDGTVCYYGLRTAPDGSEQLLFVANMEGRETTVTPIELVETTGEGWTSVLSTQGLDDPAADSPLVLADSEAVVFSRTP